MPEFNRRRFLQIAGAAGLAPVVPAFPSAAASPALTSSQMLWASLCKQNAALECAAHTMGVSGAAANGVVTKLVQANVVAVQTAANMTRAVPSTPVISKLPSMKAVQAPSVQVDVVKFLTEDRLDEDETVKEHDCNEAETTPSSKQCAPRCEN